MILTTIQAVEERFKNVKAIESLYSDSKEKMITYFDFDRISPFHSFKKILRITDKEKYDYRLHLQDDVMLPEKFTDYLPYVERLMGKLCIDVLSLFVPNRNSLKREYEHNGDCIVEFDNYLWLQATVFSRAFDDIMRDTIKQYSQENANIFDDDIFVQNTLKKYNTKAWVHLPGIVQHNVWMGSVVGHRNDKRRLSYTYDKNYCKNFIQRKNG